MRATYGVVKGEPARPVGIFRIQSDSLAGGPMAEELD